MAYSTNKAHSYKVQLIGTSMEASWDASPEYELKIKFKKHS